MKKKIVVYAVLVIICFGMGCSKEKRVEETKKVSEETNQNENEENYWGDQYSNYEEMCKDKLKEIAEKGVIPQDFPGELTYFKINEKTKRGIAFVDTTEGDMSGNSYLEVYKTEDDGKTWEQTNNQENLFVGRGKSSFYLNEKEDIYIIDCNEKAERLDGILVSKDLGESFENYHVCEFMKNQNNLVRGEILPTKREGLITVAWYPILSGDDGIIIEINQLKTSDFSLEKCLYRNEEMRNMIEHYSDEKWKEDWLYQLAKKTQKECLSKEDIENLKGFSEIFYLDYDINQLLINYIYAIHGYDFTGTDYQDYFQKCSWYLKIDKKTNNVKDKEFTENEIISIDLLQGQSRETIGQNIGR